MAKNNAEYWKERFAALENSQYTASEAYCKDLKKQFSKATVKMQEDIDKWYQRLAENNKVSYIEAKKLLDQNQLKEFHWTVEEYIKYGKENGINRKWMKELENASAKVHISRLEAMKLQIQQHAEKLFTEYEGGTTKLLNKTFSSGYYKTAFEVAKGTGVGSDLHKVDTRKIDALIRRPWAQDGASFSDRIWTNKQKLINTLHTELSQNIIRGSDPRIAINNIAKTMNVSRSAAETLVRTESAAIAAEATKQCYKDLGLEKYEILATLDSKTSDICQDLDGQVFDMKEYEVGVTAPPFHPRCRTTTVPYYDDIVSESEERAARDEETGKTYYVPANMTYKEWKEKHVRDSDWNEHKVSSNGLDSQFNVNRGIVNSKAFTDKFNGIGKNSKIDTVLRNITIDILNHRNGSKLEDVVYLDERTGKRIFLNDSSNESLGIILTLDEKEKILNHKGNIITIHNHPYGSRPSIGDIITMQRTKNISKIVVAGHNGKIYTISNINRNVDIKSIYEKELQYYKMIYSGDIYMAQEKATQAIYDMDLFEFLER